MLERHRRSLDGLAADGGTADLLAREQPVLASCYEASTADGQLLGDAPGQQTRKLVYPVREVAKPNDALELTEPATLGEASCAMFTPSIDPASDASSAFPRHGRDESCAFGFGLAEAGFSDIVAFHDAE